MEKHKPVPLHEAFALDSDEGFESVAYQEWAETVGMYSEEEDPEE